MSSAAVERGVRGSLGHLVPYPIFHMTYLIGIGLDSMNRASSIGASFWLSFFALATSPLSMSPTISLTILGRQFATTENTPSPPACMMSKFIESVPERTEKPLGLPAMIFLTCSRSPLASLMPAMLGIFESLRTVSGRTLLPVLDGTL